MDENFHDCHNNDTNIKPTQKRNEYTMESRFVSVSDTIRRFGSRVIHDLIQV